MNLKRYIAPLAVALGCVVVLGQLAFSAPSQIGTPGKTCVPAGRHEGGFGKALNLTEDQKAKIRPIMEDAKARIKALREDKSITPEIRKAKVQEIMTGVREQMKSILTPEQQQKLAQTRMHRGERFGMMGEKLGLTADQRAAIKPIVQKARAEAKAVRQDTTLTSDARTARVQEIRRSTIEQIRHLLTPEQIQKLDAVRAQHRG